MRSPNIDDTLVPPAQPVAPAASVADYSVLLRLNPNGAIVKNRGGTEQLAEVVAYAHRLAQLSGDLLGLEDFTALECTFTEGRCLIFVEANGDVVAVRPRPEANLQPLREKLGL